MTLSRRTVRSLFTLVVACGLAPAQMTTCPGSGLSVTGGRFGDAFSLEISAPPGASAILASDVAGGPIMTPYGTVCLGLTPDLAVSPMPLDASGHFAWSDVLPLAPTFPAGSTLFTQAVLAHPSLPGGYAITNGAAVTMRPPRLAAFSMPAWIGNPTVGFQSSFDLIDPVTDTPTQSTPGIPWIGGQVVHLDRLGRFGMPITQIPSWLVPFAPPINSFYCIDDLTGAPALTIPNVWSMGGGTWRVSDDGEYLFVTLTGMGATYDRVWVKTYALASGSLLSVQAVSSPNFMTRGIYHVPGTSIVYVASIDRFHVVDGATGAEIATIMLPGPLSGVASSSTANSFAFEHQGLLYCVAGNQTVTIDMTTHTVVGTPVVNAANATVPLGIGPGSVGPALWASTWTQGSSTYSLVEMPLATLSPIGVTIMTTSPLSATPSAGGTEMLVQFSGGTVMAVNAANHSTVTLAGIGNLAVLRSDTLTKAYGFTYAGVLTSFQTDPCTGVSGIVPMPPSFTTTARCLSN
jgi:hypothetical protein